MFSKTVYRLPIFLFTTMRFNSLKCLFNVQETWEAAINHEVFLI